MNVQGTCKFYVSPERPECGEVATATVRTRITGNDSATVELCAVHKAVYDQQWAQRRVERRRGASTQDAQA
ncbi:MAG TPA: hypothetical protein VIY48_18905 [Candidatus Paceibacterota bacterium]